MPEENKFENNSCFIKKQQRYLYEKIKVINIIMLK